MLKACPFCGSDDIDSSAVNSYDENIPVCWVCCEGCGAVTTEYRTSVEAEEAWNTRVRMHQLEELRDECITCNIPHWVVNFIDGILESRR